MTLARVLTRPLRRGEGRRRALEELAGGDGPLRLVMLSPLFTPLSAAAVLLLGSVVLSLWFVLVIWEGDAAASLAGAARFPTGAIGDSVLLSAAVGVSVLAYGGLADLISAEAPDEEDSRETDRPRGDSMARLQAALSSAALAWGPAVLAAVIVAAYHWEWIVSPEFWNVRDARHAATLHVPGVYHALFMTVVVWWDLALIARLGLVSADLVVPAVQRGHMRMTTARAVIATWRCVLVLALLYTAFAALLYVERIGFAPWSEAQAPDPAAVLSVALAIPLWAAVWVAHARFVSAARAAISCASADPSA